MKLKKFLLFYFLLVTVCSGADYLFTGNSRSLLAFIVLIVSSLYLFLALEIDLEGEATDNYLDEWKLMQSEAEKETFRIMLTKSAIRRELIRVWETID